MLEEYQSIIEQFDIAVKNTYKGRGAYILETDQGLKLFKEVKLHPDKIKFMYDIEEHLNHNGFNNVDRLSLTKEKKPYYHDDENKYIMKNWIKGREVYFDDEDEIVVSAKNLAKLHKKSKNFRVGAKYRTFIRAGELENKLAKHNRELSRIRNKIRKLKRWSDFDIMFLSHYDYFKEKAERALDYLIHSKYQQLSDINNKKVAITHGQYIHHNILIHNDTLFTVNFEYCSIDLPIIDLYRMTRKVLEKNNWHVNIGLKLIEAYNSIYPLSKDELEVFFYLLCYPEKFWKISNYYFNQNKAWKPKQSVIKLKKLIEQRGKKQEFLFAYKKCIL